MFNHIRKLHLNTKLIKPLIHRNNSTASEKKWDLWSSVFVERHPIITSPKTPMETKFQEMLSQIEFENSYKSDHEKNMEFDKTEVNKDDIDPDAPVKQLAQDFEEASETELAQFVFAPRSIETDNKDVNRYKMDKSLLLVINQKLGNDLHWIPPQGKRNSVETMRQAAERTLTDSCGEEFKVQWYGNAPICFFKYKYPPHVAKDGSHGAKVFCFLAKYVDGSVKKETDHQWLESNEFKSVLPDNLYKCTSRVLWNDL